MLEKKVCYTITKIGENRYRVAYWLEYLDSVPIYRNDLTLSNVDADGTTSTKTIQMKVPSIVSTTTEDSSEISYWKKNGIPPNTSSSNLSVGGMCFDVETVFNKQFAGIITQDGDF